MNISSIIIQTNPIYLEQLVNDLKQSDICDYFVHDQLGRIVVTIEGQDTGEELAKLGKLKQMPHVISAEMHFSYNENELEQMRDKLDFSPTPEWLNADDVKAEDIPYNGDLRDKRKKP